MQFNISKTNKKKVLAGKWIRQNYIEAIIDILFPSFKNHFNLNLFILKENRKCTCHLSIEFLNFSFTFGCKLFRGKASTKRGMATSRFFCVPWCITSLAQNCWHLLVNKTRTSLLRKQSRNDTVIPGIMQS